jgi:hypothetical protein
MNYNALFIRAIHLMQQHDGEQAAAMLFNTLFKVSENKVVATPQQLHTELNNKVGFYVYLGDIARVNSAVATPFPGWSSAVAWIKECRNMLSCGLKEAKDIHDFVRDNPRVIDSI